MVRLTHVVLVIRLSGEIMLLLPKDQIMVLQILFTLFKNELIYNFFFRGLNFNKPINGKKQKKKPYIIFNGNGKWFVQ